jgi:hypothetical protein
LCSRNVARATEIGSRRLIRDFIRSHARKWLAAPL